MTQQISHYQIIEELGRGGMATVYRAMDTRFEREVAVKILPPYFMHDPDFPRRFQREAKVIASLEHKGIVPVYDYGEADGKAYLVMRYMKGGSLADKIGGGALSLDETIPIMERVAEALDFAHSKGVIHRDIKPGNILFDEFGEAFLADFGIAKLAEETTTFTDSSGLLGTPAYISPEQVQGGKPDHLSDIYALGIVLFEMLAGQQPYQAETPMGLLFKHTQEPIPSLCALRPALPKTIDSVIQQALSKEPIQRYQSGKVLVVALSGNDAKIVASSSGDVPKRKPPLFFGGIGFVILLLLLWGGRQLIGERKEPEIVASIPTLPVDVSDTTNTATSTVTVAPTNTLKPTATKTPTLQPTNTPKLTSTKTPTPQPTNTNTPTVTNTPTSRPTNTNTPTATSTSSVVVKTPTPTANTALYEVVWGSMSCCSRDHHPNIVNGSDITIDSNELSFFYTVYNPTDNIAFLLISPPSMMADNTGGLKNLQTSWTSGIHYSEEHSKFASTNTYGFIYIGKIAEIEISIPNVTEGSIELQPKLEICYVPVPFLENTLDIMYNNCETIYGSIYNFNLKQ